MPSNDPGKLASEQGSNVATQYSYALFRFCANQQQEWIGVTSELPLDSNGLSYLMLGPQDGSRAHSGVACHEAKSLQQVFDGSP